MAGKIFINYRRALNLKDAQLLEKVLQRKFGAGRVFLDTSGLDGGKQWLHALEAQVDASAAMVSLIGKGWADAADEKGARRLDNPDDSVRFEIARAFSRRIPVLPVLIDGAPMPDVPQLPRNLLPLLFVQAMLLRAESVNDDAQKIADRLAALINEAKPGGIRAWLIGASAAAALATGLAAGPAVQTALGIRQPAADAGLKAALDQAKAAKDRTERRAADAEAASRAAVRTQKQAESNYAAALGERDRAQAELKRAQEALAAAQSKSEAAEVRADEPDTRLRASEAMPKDAKAEAPAGAPASPAAPPAALDSLPVSPGLTISPLPSRAAYQRELLLEKVFLHRFIWFPKSLATLEPAFEHILNRPDPAGRCIKKHWEKYRQHRPQDEFKDFLDETHDREISLSQGVLAVFTPDVYSLKAEGILQCADNALMQVNPIEIEVRLDRLRKNNANEELKEWSSQDKRRWRFPTAMEAFAISTALLNSKSPSDEIKFLATLDSDQIVFAFKKAAKELPLADWDYPGPSDPKVNFVIAVAE